MDQQEKTIEEKPKLVSNLIFGLIVFTLCFAAGYKLWLSNKPSDFVSEYSIDLDSSSEQEVFYENAEINNISEDEALLEARLNQEFILNEGDTLSSILTEANINNKDANAIISSFSTKINPKKLNIGTPIQIQFAKKNDTGAIAFNSMTVNISNTKKIIVSMLENNHFIANEIIAPLKQHIIYEQGVIKNSFINTARELSIPSNAIMAMVRAFSYDVDFQRDIKNGNKLEVVMEKFYTEDGQLSHTGNVLYSSLILNDRKVSIYQMTDSNGQSSYYNEKGETIKKDFLRTPMNAAKITSKFGMRNHPVLGYSKMHKGVDFAAPVNTPILAAGDGVVESATRMSGYGKYIRIKHNSTYSTAYAHANKFAKGVKVGTKVKQGQVIAYVGMTGVTTGPHLHYEVLKNGKQINPLSFKFSSMPEKLKGKELEQFNKNKKKIEKYLTT